MARRGRAETDRGAAAGEPAVPGSEIAAAADGGHAAPGWLRLGRDGRLTAYASCAEGLVRWTESAPGSDLWHGPDLFPVEGWSGRFTLTQDAHGFVWFAATRHRDGAPEGREFVIAAQYQTSRPLSEWRAMGNPFPPADASAPEPGTPVVLADGAGSLHYFVTRFGVGVRARTQGKDGSWSAWADHELRWVRGAVVPTAQGRGRVGFLAPFRGGAVQLGQEKPGEGAFTWLGRMEADAAEGTYSSIETSPGVATHFWRAPADGAVIACRPPGTGVVTTGGFMSLGGAGGVGPVGAVRTPINGYDCTVLLQRGAEGYPEIAAYPTEGEQYGTWWAPVGDRCAGLPAVALDARGSVTIAMIDTDGGLRIARQDLAAEGLAFGPWRRVG
ncbi:hypothetical protein [Streptomyces subrutilus]|uniref:hypothetical protein n=1 Tax=Streptomyces subrutilus TaxID=36818 RepID=UPI0034021757